MLATNDSYKINLLKILFMNKKIKSFFACGFPHRSMPANDLCTNWIFLYVFDENWFLFDRAGRILYRNLKVNAHKIVILTYEYSKQILIVKVITNQGKIVTKKIVIN